MCLLQRPSRCPHLNEETHDGWDEAPFLHSRCANVRLSVCSSLLQVPLWHKSLRGDLARCLHLHGSQLLWKEQVRCQRLVMMWNPDRPQRWFIVLLSHRVQLWAGEAVSVHHVRTEELPPCSLPQLETRSDRGTLYVRHPAENPRDLHRARGLLLTGSGFYRTSK